jgi:type I restriction enzyme S subunit
MSTDAYVIAVNGRRLRSALPQLDGISQVPFAAEAVFAIGPMQIHLDRVSHVPIGQDHQYRPFVRKQLTNATVPTQTFLDLAYAPISAIWALYRDDCRAIGNRTPMAIVHNPNAAVPPPPGVLLSDSEWSADTRDPQTLTLKRTPRS